ncbi:MAG: hypothetical protein IJT43_05955 [Stomatobaculum sp.]|nr:hypothetical protein [Stomatobaculum sp.]
MKLGGLKKKFENGHPKLFRFLGAVVAPGLPEGTVLELTVKKPGEEPVTTNMKLTAEDMEILSEIREILQ